MKDISIQEQRLRSITEEYNNEILKVSKLYPCKLCGSVKYLLTDDRLQKACEKDCENLKIYNEMVGGITVFYKALIDKISPQGKE